MVKLCNELKNVKHLISKRKDGAHQSRKNFRTRTCTLQLHQTAFQWYIEACFKIWLFARRRTRDTSVIWPDVWCLPGLYGNWISESLGQEEEENVEQHVWLPNVLLAKSSSCCHKCFSGWNGLKTFLYAQGTSFAGRSSNSWPEVYIDGYEGVQFVHGSEMQLQFEDLANCLRFL